MTTVECARCRRRGERGYVLGEADGAYGWHCTNIEACRRRQDAPVVENREYAAFMARTVAALGRRAGSDPDFLPALAQLQAAIADQMVEAVAACRQDGYSWAEIGTRLGITRQSAQERFSRRLAG